MCLFLRVRPRKKRGGGPLSGKLTLSMVKDQSDVYNFPGNWIIFSETSSHWKSEARRRGSWIAPKMRIGLAVLSRTSAALWWTIESVTRIFSPIPPNVFASRHYNKISTTRTIGSL